MTADRTSVRLRRPAVLAGAAALLLGVSACSSGGSTAGSGRLSYDQVRSTARDLSAGGACPFGLDLAAALKAAGIERPVTAGAGKRPVAEGELGDGLPAQPWPATATPLPGMPSIPATPPSAQITCHYTVGATPVRVDLLATPVYGPAFALMLPHIQRHGAIKVRNLEQFAAEQPGAGQTAVTPEGGRVGVARVASHGPGDLALVVAQDTEARTEPALTGEPLRKVTERLAAQLRP
ncbi:hypothetical protein ACWGB8_24255 [Kitasatospora sp. NPDC054939]